MADPRALGAALQNYDGPAMRAYEPSWRDRIASALMGDTHVSPERANFVSGLMGSRGLGSTGAGVVDFTPAGAVLQGQEAARSGDAKGMALAAIGALPGVGPAERAAAMAAREAAPAVERGIIAYHGSPHSFDKFDMSKIGTGEGAQAYGHGLYFAEAEDTAKAYRDALKGIGQPFEWNGKQPQDRGEFFNIVDNLNNDDWRLAKIVENAGAHGPAHAMSVFEPNTRNASDGALWQAAMDKFKEGAGNSAKGSMYQVRINADPEHFLDWDKPLWEQPQTENIKKVFDKYGVEVSPSDFESNLDGVWNRAAETITEPRLAKELAQSGVPGIKYLDAGSRGAGNGSRNYVVFDDNLVEILKKYGLVGLLGGGSAMGAAQQGQEAPGL